MSNHEKQIFQDGSGQNSHTVSEKSVMITLENSNKLRTFLLEIANLTNISLQNQYYMQKVD
jgi:hypothetical protein